MYKNHKQDLISFVIYRFWEHSLKKLDIYTREKNGTAGSLFSQKSYLNENVLLKNLQLTDKSEILISVCFKNKELRHQIKQAEKVNQLFDPELKIVLFVNFRWRRCPTPFSNLLNLSSIFTPVSSSLS